MEGLSVLELLERARNAQLELPVDRPPSRRRRILEQLTTADGVSIRDQARTVENAIAWSPLQRGRRWPRPYERTVPT